MYVNKTEQRIIDSFVSLYKQKPLNKIRAIEICEAAGITRTTFYTYFESVGHVLSLVEQQTREDQDRIMRDLSFMDIEKFRSKDRAIPMFVRIYEYVNDRRDTYQALFGPHGRPEFSFEYADVITRSIYELLVTKFEEESQALRIVPRLAEGCITRISQAWIFGEIDASPEEIGLIATRAVIALIEEWE